MGRLIFALGLFLFPSLAWATCPAASTDCPSPTYNQVKVGDPTGGFKGAGSINTQRLYIDGVLIGPPGTGTVTNIATGSGLTGGPITTTGTISCVDAASSTKGCPTPDGTSTHFLSGAGTWLTPAGASGITALTGDGTASGPGSAALTLATVNSVPGSVGSSTSIPVLTTNGKGLVTAQTTAAVVAPAGTLTGATLASNVLTSSLTSVGTLAGLTVTSSFTATGLVTNADLVSPSITVNGSTCTLGSSCTPIAGGLVVGSTAIGGGTTTKVLFDNAGTLGEYTVSGSANVAMTTSPVFTTPNLGTPSALVLTNATGLPCGAMPALTGGVTSSAGSCATTAASVPTSALTGTVTNSKTITFDSTTAVTAQTISFPIEWTSYTITSVKTAVNGGGSFTANVKIGSTSATGCSAISVSGATNTVTTCTAANTGSANDIINVVLSAPSGTVNQAYVSVVFTHTVN